MADKSSKIVEEADVKKLIQIVTGNWLVLLLALLLSIVAAYFYSYRLPKIYAAKTQLIMKSDETYPIQQGILQGLGISGSGFYGYEKMSNEKRVLVSTDLVSQVISKLKLDVTYSIVGRLQTREVYAGTPFRVEVQIYNPSFHELPFIFKMIDVNSFELSYDYKDNHFTGKYQFGEPIINKDFYLVAVKSDAINKSSIGTLRDLTYQINVHNRYSLLSNFKNSLSVKDLDYTAILEVTMEDEIPERAIMFLDTLSSVYVSNSLQSKIRINENTINYIDKQLGEVTFILDSIEQMMQDFKEQKNILNISKEETEYYTNLSSFELKKRGLELQQKNLSYLKNYITSNMNKELLPPSLYLADGDVYLNQAISQLYAIQVGINGALFGSTEKSTSIKESEYRIQLLRNDILKYIFSTEKAIGEKIISIDEEIAFYTNLLHGVPRNQREMLNIERKMQVNEKMYLYLLEKRAETIIARAGIVSEIRTIESAHSIGIVKPDKVKIYYSFISIGLLMAVIIGFFRAIFFSNIDNAEELRAITAVPVLGEIFHSIDAKDSYLIVDINPRSFVTEAFRALRTNLDYFSPNTKSKVVIATSNRPGVGKTFCSINLAVILAKGGKKVLLLELDLHKPKIHTAFKLSSDIGMSSVLAGKVDVKEAIMNTSIENLDVILSGPSPPNASELLLSTHFSNMITYAKERYDYVVIDTPPMGILSDALIMMKYSDINIFILNTKHNPSEGVRFANDISNNKVGSFVFVLNSVQPKSSKYYYRGYKYAYGYGSGYLKG